MKYDEPKEIAESLAKQAFQNILQRKVTPHPDKFAVWYTYAGGKNAELKAEMDRALAEGERIDDNLLAGLYEKYLAEEAEREELNAASERIQQTLEQVMAYVNSASSGASHYGETLENFHGDIAKSESTEELQALVANVLTETKDMVEMNKKLEQQLTDSTGEIARLREEVVQVRQEASTDGLTGLPNRKTLDATIQEEAEKAKSSRSFLSFIMSDVDHFKKFNDTYGHQLGDQVLKLVAATMTQTVRGQDTPARYGGEEFCVVLPNTNLQEARKVAENIRNAVASKKLVNRRKGMDLGKITLSLGVSEYSLGEDVSTFMKRADDALYAAKRSGRNKVVTQLEAEALLADSRE